MMSVMRTDEHLSTSDVTVAYMTNLEEGAGKYGQINLKIIVININI